MESNRDSLVQREHVENLWIPKAIQALQSSVFVTIS